MCKWGHLPDDEEYVSGSCRSVVRTPDEYCELPVVTLTLGLTLCTIDDCAIEPGVTATKVVKEAMSVHGGTCRSPSVGRGNTSFTTFER